MAEPSARFHVAQATFEDVVWAANVATRTYSGHDVIPEATMVEWWKANPSGFLILRRDGVRVGNLDVLPLRKSAIEQLLAGSLLEREIRGSDILPAGERSTTSDLYVESLVVEAHARANSVPLLHLLAAFKSVAVRLCAPSPPCMVHAISATTEGAALLRGLRFSTVGESSSRRDEHQLWSAPLRQVAERIDRLRRTSPEPDL